MSDRLTEIARANYETGAFGDAFFVMSKATTDQLPRPSPPPPFDGFDLAGRGVFGLLSGIPIIFDAALPLGAWKLIDRATGQLIERSEGFWVDVTGVEAP